MDLPQRNALRIASLRLAILACHVAPIKKLLASNSYPKTLVGDVIHIASRPFRWSMVRDHFGDKSRALFLVLVRLGTAGLRLSGLL
jgi:hypothetical protein